MRQTKGKFEMCDKTELQNEADSTHGLSSAESAVHGRLVIRWIPQFSRWYLCHAATYQNAFGKDVGGFKTRVDAAEFAVSKGFEIEKHKHDQLQNYL